MERVHLADRDAAAHSCADALTPTRDGQVGAVAPRVPEAERRLPPLPAARARASRPAAEPRARGPGAAARREAPLVRKPPGRADARDLAPPRRARGRRSAERPATLG